MRDSPSANRGTFRHNERSLCPNCRRLTNTSARGSCTDCWAPKVEGGEPGLRPREPRTEPILDGFLEDIGLVIIILVGTGLAGLLIRLIVDYYIS